MTTGGRFTLRQAQGERGRLDSRVKHENDGRDGWIPAFAGMTEGGGNDGGGG